MEALETPRLVMRPFRESDWDAYAAMSADAEVMRYIGMLGSKALVYEAVRP